MKESWKQNHLFIVNSKSGKGKSEEYLGLLSSLALKEDTVYVEQTSTIQELKEVLDRYRNKVGRIYAVGGDGTLSVLISEVMKRGLNHFVEIGTLPAGTGNDYIRNLTNHDFSFANPEEQIALMLNGRSTCIDIGRVNREYFVNITSVGIDADVIGNSLHFKNKKSVPVQFAYLISAFYTIFRQKKRKSPKVRLDGRPIRGEFLLVAIGKGKFYGSGIKVLPDAELTGGYFSVLKVDCLSKRRIFSLIKKFIDGRHKDIPETHFFTGKKVEFTSESEFALQYDGEIMYVKEAAVELIPQAIKMIVP